MLRATAVLAVLTALLAGAATAAAATIPVTTTADVTAADGLCSLREAVFAARSDQAVPGCPAGTPGADVIQLGPWTFQLEPGPGGTTEDGNESGDLDSGPGNALRIAGAGAG